MKRSELRQIIREEIQKISLNEATRGMIGMLLPNGKVKAVYSHYDNHPNTNGKILKKNYKDPKKVKELIDGGNLSVLGDDLESTKFYGGEKASLYKSPEEFAKVTPEEADAEYVYLYNPKTKRWQYQSVGRWGYAPVSDDWENL